MIVRFLKNSRKPLILSPIRPIGKTQTCSSRLTHMLTVGTDVAYKSNVDILQAPLTFAQLSLTS